MTKITIVIPTNNRASDLDDCLKSINEQTFPKEEYEVIVFDNGSTDNTKEISLKWEKAFEHFKYHYDENPGLHVGRNYGYTESTSPYIVFVDDDIVAEKNWLLSIVEAFEADNQIMMVGGNDYPMFLATPPAWVDELFTKNDKVDARLLSTFSCIEFGGDKREISPYYVFGCNMAIRRELLDKTNGFHPDGMPNFLLKYRGDGESYVSDTLEKSNGKAYFVPGASVFHKIPLSRLNKKYVYYVAYRSGISYAYSQTRKNEKIDYEIFHARKYEHILRRHVSNIWREGRNAGIKFFLKQIAQDKNLLEWINQEEYLYEKGIIPCRRDCN